MSLAYGLGITEVLIADEGGRAPSRGWSPWSLQARGVIVSAIVSFPAFQANVYL
jgi:hypothetical protein